MCSEFGAQVNFCKAWCSWFLSNKMGVPLDWKSTVLYCFVFIWSYDIWHNNIHHNDKNTAPLSIDAIQHNDTQPDDTRFWMSLILSLTFLLLCCVDNIMTLNIMTFSISSKHNNKNVKLSMSNTQNLVSLHGVSLCCMASTLSDVVFLSLWWMSWHLYFVKVNQRDKKLVNSILTLNLTFK